MVSPVQNTLADTKPTCVATAHTSNSSQRVSDPLRRSNIAIECSTYVCFVLRTKATTVAGSAHRSSPSASKVPHSLIFFVEKGKNEFFRSRRTRRPDLRVPTDT
jgi:hypothetical protein